MQEPPPLWGVGGGVPSGLRIQELDPSPRTHHRSQLFADAADASHRRFALLQLGQLDLETHE